MSTTWDWSPVFGPQGAISNYLQNMQYQKQLQAMMGQQNDVPTPGMQANVQLPSTQMPGADMFAPSQNGGKLAPSAYSHGSFSPPGMPQGASVQGGPITVGGGNIDVSTPSVGTHTEFTGPVGQALGNDQASALMPFLQALGPRGLPMLMQTTQNAIAHNQDRADKQWEWQNEPSNLSPGQHRFINGKDVASVPEEVSTTLTPQQAQVAGLPKLENGSFYQRSPKGEISVVKTSDMLSPGRVKQEEGIHAADSAGSGWQVVLDPSTQQPYRYNSKTAQATTMDGRAMAVPAGYQKPSAYQPRTAVAIYMDQWNRENPKATAADKATAMNIFSGQQSEQHALGTMGGKVEASTAGLDNVIGQANDAYKKLPRGQFVPFNKLAQLAQTNAFSSPEQADAYAADAGVINMWAKSINPTGVLTVENAKRGAEMLSQAQSPEAHAAVLERMRREGSASVGGINHYRNIGPQQTTTPAPAPTGNNVSDPLGIR